MDLRRATAIALVAAPAIFLIDNVIHPEEFSTGHETEQLRAIAEHYTRWQFAHVLALIAVVLFAPVVAGLGALVARRSPRTGVIGAALGMVGLLGLAAAVAIDGFAWGILGEVYARSGESPAVATALKDMQSSEWGLPYYSLIAGWIVGMCVLCRGLVTTGQAPAWAAGLLALGTLMVGVEGAVKDNAYFIAAAAVLLAGGVAVAATLSPSAGSAASSAA